MLARPYDALVKRSYRIEFTWPPVVCLAIILGLSLLLKGRYRLLPPPVVLSLLALAFVCGTVAFFAANSGRFKFAWYATVGLVSLLSIVVIGLLTNLLVLLVQGGSDVHGWNLLLSGIHVWVSNVLAFGLWYWLLDRGGPHARMTEQRSPELLFPEMTAGDFANPKWSPNVFEYMYLSFTNSTAFSPTDTLPLSSRIRMLMMAESAMSLATIALVTARAVNILT
jgi:hypothetical protein